MEPKPVQIPPQAWHLAGQQAAESLATWVGRPVRLEWSLPSQVTLETAAELLGPPEAVVAACILEVAGAATGRLVMVADALAIAAFVNSMTTGETAPTPVQEELIATHPQRFWDELMRSAALETANIIACSYLNALSSAYQDEGIDQAQAQLLPGPPRFALDYAASLSEFLLADVPESLDGVMVSQSRMHLENAGSSDWSLVWIPIQAAHQGGGH